jgi:hypothetical protein
MRSIITNPYIRVIYDALEANAINIDPTKGMFIMSIQYAIAEEYGRIECSAEELIGILKTKVSLCFEIERGFRFLDGPFDETSEKATRYIMLRETVCTVVKENEEHNHLIEI